MWQGSFRLKGIVYNLVSKATTQTGKELLKIDLQDEDGNTTEILLLGRHAEEHNLAIGDAITILYASLKANTTQDNDKKASVWAYNNSLVYILERNCDLLPLTKKITCTV